MDTFTVEFHRRLIRLYEALSYYFETGRVGNVLPALFSCVSYLWCKSPFKNSKK